MLSGTANQSPFGSRSLNALGGGLRPVCAPVDCVPYHTVQTLGKPTRGIASSRPRELIAVTGTLSIKVKPWALVWCDGQSLGQTPVLESIGAGRHWLKLQRPDGTAETVQITVKPDRETTLTRDWSQ
jgi:hypothetical protein